MINYFLLENTYSTFVASVARHVVSQLSGFLYGCLKAISQQWSYSLDHGTSTRQHNTPWLKIPWGHPFIKPTVYCCVAYENMYTDLLFTKSNHFNQVVVLTRSHKVLYTSKVHFCPTKKFLALLVKINC